MRPTTNYGGKIIDVKKPAERSQIADAPTGFGVLAMPGYASLVELIEYSENKNTTCAHIWRRVGQMAESGGMDGTTL